MAQQYRDVTQIRVWPNDKGMAKYGNSKWTPYKEGAPGDVHLRGSVQYSVRVFENDDGSMTLKISEKLPYTNTDNLADDVSQPGMRQIAETIGVQERPTSQMNLDDDVPF
jgi:hypothetical protein